MYNYEMNKVNRVVSALSFFFLTVLIVIATFFFLEQSVITDVTPGYYFDPISIPTQIILAAIIVTLISIFSIYFVRRIRISINSIIIISILLAFLVMMIVNIVTIPETRNLTVKFLDGTFHELVLTLSPQKRTIAILSIVVNIAFFYFIVIALPNHKNFLAVTKFFIAVIVSVSMVAIIYSFVTEWDIIEALLKNGYVSWSLVPSSFFNNRNPYASFLLSSQIMLIFLYYLSIRKKRRFIYFLLQIPLMFGIFLTFSKTNMVLSFALFVFVFYRNIWHLARIKRYKTVFVLVFLSSSLITFVILAFSLPQLRALIGGPLLESSLPGSLFGEGWRTFSTRIGLWTQAVSLIIASPTTLLIGDGPHLSRFFFQMRIDLEKGIPFTYNHGDYHNGFIEVFHTFGVIGLSTYVLMFIVFVILIFKRRRANRPLAFFTLISLLIFIARSQSESFSMLLFKSEGIMASFTFILPFLYLNKLAHHSGHGRDILKKAG